MSLAAASQIARVEVPPDAIESNGKAVGLVATLDHDGNYQEKYMCFFVADGVLVTAYQTVADADAIEVLLPDGSKVREPET